MGRKCSVYGCKSGYATNTSDTDISMFRFPKDTYQRKLWLLALPNGGLTVDNITDQMVVCSKHWKGGKEGSVPMKSVRGGSKVPIVPPDFFGLCDKDSVAIPPSVMPTPPPLQRSTKKSSASSRSVFQLCKMLQDKEHM